jgi:hypothetical protein
MFQAGQLLCRTRGAAHRFGELTFRFRLIDFVEAPRCIALDIKGRGVSLDASTCDLIGSSGAGGRRTRPDRTISYHWRTHIFE